MEIKSGYGLNTDAELKMLRVIEKADAIGGTAIGAELLDLCGRTYALLAEDLEDLTMVLVCGPRLEADALDPELHGPAYQLVEALRAKLEQAGR